MALSKQQIFGAVDLPKNRVDVPEWAEAGKEADAYVFVRTMTARERDAFEELTFHSNGKDVDTNLANFRARLVTLTAVDDDGARIFDDGDVQSLGDKSGKVIARLFEAANALNGFGKDEVDQLAKNS